MFAASKTASVSGAAPDGQFNYVTMLLHGDGTNGAQNNTFLDSSTNNFTITRNGNTTQGSFSPYGSNWSNYFNASSSYLTAPAASIADFGTGDFIVEAWFNCASTTGNQKIFDNYNGNNNPNPTLLLNIGGAGKVSWYAGQTAVINSSSTFSVGVWNYVVVSRVSSTTKMFLNGTEVGSVSDTRTYAAGYTNVGIGAEANGGGSAFNGYISNLRVVKGSGVTSSTIPTTPSTAITNTVLLTCQSNRFIDNSSNAYTITANGSTSVQRFNPFGTSTAYSTSVIGGSGYFDGSGDYLTAPDDASLNLSADFTVEAWVNLDNISSEYCVFHNHTSNVNGVAVTVNSGAPRLLSGNGSWSVILDSSITIKPNTWNHIAGTRSGNTYTIWVNGVSGGTASSATTPSYSGGAQIGRFISSAPLAFPGYMSNLRVVKGTAVYTTTFTPSTTPLTAISGTSLLLYYTNGAIFDNAMMNDLETVGNAQISTSVKKYGTGSLAFDGTGDYLKGPPNPWLALGANDYTIEMWVNFNSVSTSVLFGNIDGSGNGNWAFFYNSTAAVLRLLLNNGAVVLSSSSWTPSTGTWYHIAICRASGTYRFFIDGTVTGSGSNSTNIDWGGITNSFYVGSANDGTLQLNGYIDDLRITKGYARYTANFTAPTAALSDTGPY